MPRRRKKTGDQKRPLMFVESPCEGPRHDTTMVSAADSPITADIVMVDPDDTSAWVSPQFRASQMACSEPKRRKRGTKKTSNNQSAVVGRRKRNPTGQENINAAQTNDIKTRLKYGVLKFEGERTLPDSSSSNDSSLEELDISEEEDAPRCLEEQQVTPNRVHEKGLRRLSKTKDHHQENRANREPLLPPKDWMDKVNTAARDVLVQDTPVGCYGMKVSARRRQELLRAKSLPNLE
ncbi:Hypp1782 [Branchiostoma lanceolatum]|nr:Hypp1782 [Branchiostoma lanceolatum]